MSFEHLSRYENNTEFDLTKFQPVKNHPGGNGKPYPNTGLWACRAGSDNRWRDHSQSEMAVSGFIFDLNLDSHLIYIDASEQVDELPVFATEIHGDTHYSIDWEKVAAEYDALFADNPVIQEHPLFWGWDVPSLLVFNPYCVITQ